MLRLIAFVSLSPILMAQAVEFHFAPPDGTTFTETVTSHRTMDNGPMKMDDEISVSANTTIHKTPNGYAITRIATTKNGNQFETAMNGLPVTWTVDGGGHFQGASGYDKPLADFKAKLPEKSQEQVSDALTPDTLSARDRQEWDSRIGRLAGKKFNLYQSWVEDTQVPGPNGDPIPMKTTCTVTAMADCAAGKCARVKVTSKSADGAPVEMQTETEMLIDPNTGLIYSETLTRNAKIKQQDHAVSIAEKKETSYKYAAAQR